MLTDKQIEALYAKMIWRMDEVNTEYLKTVGEQIKAIGKLNPSSINKIAQMRRTGASSARIKRELQKALKMSADEVQGILDQAAQEEYKNHDFLGVQRGRKPIPLKYNQVLQTYIRSVAAQTAETFMNYSNTTNLDEQYQEVVSQAVDAVSRGVTDYNQAIRASMRKLGGDGLRVTYESGLHRRMDTAIRMNMLDSVRQVSMQAAKIAGEESGADGVELSAHPFSAIDHEDIQGRMFTFENYERMQLEQPFEDVDGHQYKAIRRPITQWNCRHFASPVQIGISHRRYTDEQLAQWKKTNHDGCEIDGQHYTIYQASQLMRKIETEVRRQKDIANLAKISGDDVLRREAQAKIVGLKAKYKHVAEQAKLRARPDKMVVESFTKEMRKEGEQDAENRYQNWSGGIGANDSIENLAEYYNVRYNEPERYRLLQTYATDVKDGWVSPLVHFSGYEEMYNRIQNEAIGLKTKDGILVTGQSRHFMQRVVGTMVDPLKFKKDHTIIRRSGVTIDDIIDTIQNGIARPPRKSDSGNVSVVILGENCKISINPATGNLIQCSQRSE